MIVYNIKIGYYEILPTQHKRISAEVSFKLRRDEKPTVFDLFEKAADCVRPGKLGVIPFKFEFGYAVDEDDGMTVRMSDLLSY